MIEIPFFPVEASTIAWQVDLLLVVLIAISGFFTTIVMLLILYFSVKYRKGAEADRSNPPLTSFRVEMAWIGGLLVLALGTFTGATLVYFNIFAPPENALDIYVVGKQWMWKFQHQEGPREIDELHVPIGRPVRLLMTSQDVIHSFYVPAFRMKHDVIPGQYTNLFFEATKTGEFHIFCAEYCGTNHSLMIGTVIVMEPQEYQKWLSGNQTGQPLAQSGEQLFQQVGCSSCHAPDSDVRAPSLVGLFGREVQLESGETITADENYIRESIIFPQRRIVAGYEPIMPTYEGRITEEQILELIAYILTLDNQSNQ